MSLSLIKHQLVFLFLFSFWRTSKVAGLAPPTPAVTSRPFVEISSLIRRPGDRLPSSFVTQWPTWVLRIDDDDDDDDDTIAAEWSRIPNHEAQGDDASGAGFVNPVSLEELWLPLDLRPPQLRLALGLHVRNGAIRHVFPAVDLTLTSASTTQEHRNRGLCSVPLAYQWQELSAFMALGSSNHRMVLETRSTADAEDEWEPCALELSRNQVQQMIAGALEALAQEPPTRLGEGSHVVHVVLDDVRNGNNDAVTECPKADHDLRVVLQSVDEGNDDGTHELQVRIASTAAGSTSEYLLDCYRPLFEDPSLRRPAYDEAQRRLNTNSRNKGSVTD